jgi:hypothetical protein
MVWTSSLQCSENIPLLVMTTCEGQGCDISFHPLISSHSFRLSHSSMSCLSFPCLSSLYPYDPSFSFQSHCHFGVSISIHFTYPNHLSLFLNSLVCSIPHFFIPNSVSSGFLNYSYQKLCILSFSLHSICIYLIISLSPL